MDLRDADKGADVFAVLFLQLGDLGESLSEFLVVVDVHGGHEFQGLIDGFQSLVNGARLAVRVVCHGGDVSSLHHRMIDIAYRPHQCFRFPFHPRNAQP